MYKKIILLLLIVFSFGVEAYDRIVILDPAVVETVYILGGEGKIVAIAHANMTPIEPEEKTKKLASVGSVNRPNFEKIMSFKPDLVVIGTMNESIVSSLEKFDIKYVKYDIKNIDGLLENILEVGKLIGKEQEAEKLYLESFSKIEKIKYEIAKNPLELKGTFVYNANPLMAFNHKSIRGEILDIFGVDDLAEGVVGQRPILSPEYIMKENPDFLLGIMVVKSVEDILRSNEYLAGTNVGKDKNIRILDSNRIMRLSPFLVDEIVKIYGLLGEIKENKS